MPGNADLPDATSRHDPYRNFKFRLKLDGTYVAGVSRVNGLAQTQVISHRDGADPTPPSRMPGQSAFPAVILERGVTHDVAFEQWANTVWDYRNQQGPNQQGGGGNQAVPLEDFRKDVVLEVYDEAGQKVIAYTIRRCWPSQFAALPEMDANGNAIAIMSLTLENEGWERAVPVGEPDEPGFMSPG